MILFLGTNLARAEVELGLTRGRVKVDQGENLGFFIQLLDVHPINGLYPVGGLWL